MQAQIEEARQSTLPPSPAFCITSALRRKGERLSKSTSFSDRHQISDPGSLIGSLARSLSSAASTTNRSTLSAYKSCTLHLYPWCVVTSPPEARRLLRLRHMAISTPEARKGFSRTHVWRLPPTHADRSASVRPHKSTVASGSVRLPGAIDSTKLYEVASHESSDGIEMLRWRGWRGWRRQGQPGRQ